MNGVQKTIKIASICFGILIIINIFSAIFWLVSGLTGFKSDKRDVSFEKEYSNIDSIVIDMPVSNISIEPSNTFKVEANGMSKNFNVKAKNGTLTLHEKGGWSWFKNYGGDVTVYVPQSVKLNKLSIDNGAGVISINHISSYLLDIDGGAGKLSISYSSFDEADIDAGVGETNIESSRLNNLDLDAGVGKININAFITGNSKIDCGVGAVNITLLGNREDYSIKAEKGLGSIKIDKEEKRGDFSYGYGINRIELDGGVGSINVNFMRESLAQ